MGLLTRKTDSNPLSKNIDELLDGMNQESPGRGFPWPRPGLPENDGFYS